MTVVMSALIHKEKKTSACVPDISVILSLCHTTSNNLTESHLGFLVSVKCFWRIHQ